MPPPALESSERTGATSDAASSQQQPPEPPVRSYKTEGSTPVASALSSLHVRSSSAQRLRALSLRVNVDDGESTSDEQASSPSSSDQKVSDSGGGKSRSSSSRRTRQVIKAGRPGDISLDDSVMWNGAKKCWEAVPLPSEEKGFNFSFEVSDSADGTKCLSLDEKKSAHDSGNSLLYGEVLSTGISMMLDANHLNAAGADVLCDLGMGFGKFVLQAFIEFPHLSRVVGVELSSSRFRIACTNLQNFVDSETNLTVHRRDESSFVVKQRTKSGRSRILEFYQGDLFDFAHIASASDIVILAVNIPFERTFPKIAAYLSKLKVGSRLATYLDISNMYASSRTPFPFRQQAINMSSQDRFPTTWARYGFHFLLWDRVSDREAKMLPMQPARRVTGSGVSSSKRNYRRNQRDDKRAKSATTSSGGGIGAAATSTIGPHAVSTADGVPLDSHGPSKAPLQRQTNSESNVALGGQTAGSAGVHASGSGGNKRRPKRSASLNNDVSKDGVASSASSSAGGQTKRSWLSRVRIPFFSRKSSKKKKTHCAPASAGASQSENSDTSKTKPSKQTPAGSPIVGVRRSLRANGKDSPNSNKPASRKASRRKSPISGRSKSTKTTSSASTSSIPSPPSAAEQGGPAASGSAPNNVIMRGRTTYVSMVSHRRSLPALSQSEESSPGGGAAAESNVSRASFAKEANAGGGGGGEAESAPEKHEAIALQTLHQKSDDRADSRCAVVPTPAEAPPPYTAAAAAAAAGGGSQCRSVRLTSRDSLPSLDSPTPKLPPPDDATFLEEKRESGEGSDRDDDKECELGHGEAGAHTRRSPVASGGGASGDAGSVPKTGAGVSLSSRHIREHERGGNDLYSSPSSSSSSGSGSSSQHRVDVDLAALSGGSSGGSSSSLVCGDTDGARRLVGTSAN